MRPRSGATGAVSATLVPSHLLAFLGRSGVESILPQRKVTRWSPCNLAVTCYESSSATGWVVAPRIRQETCTRLGRYVRPAPRRQRGSPRCWSGNGSLRGRYGARALHALVFEAGVSAGVTDRHHPHRWRHTYATSLVRLGEDIQVVQRLMGHSNIATTTRYLYLSDADLLAAIDRAFPES
ncbi:MAG: tyrosine-type recombinase/integrase [Acidimicrobiales bacterium]